MRFFLRLIALAALGGGIFYLYTLAAASQQDASRLVSCYAGIILLGAGAAVLLATWFLPLLGDLVGGFLYDPPTEERHPHADALAKVAAGDYAGAIEAYEKRLEVVPEDILAVNDAVRLYRERLHDPAGAAQFLERMLEYGNWSDYQRRLLYDRLQEIRATVSVPADAETQYETHHDTDEAPIA